MKYALAIIALIICSLSMKSFPLIAGLSIITLVIYITASLTSTFVDNLYTKNSKTNLLFLYICKKLSHK